MMLTQVERAKAVYESEPCARTFREELEAHLMFGFVFSRPDFFVMGRPVIMHADYELVVDPFHAFPSAECDCWHIACYAGNLAPAMSIMPWSLPWVSFERKNELRYYPLARLAEMTRQFLPTCKARP